LGAGLSLSAPALSLSKPALSAPSILPEVKVSPAAVSAPILAAPQAAAPQAPMAALTGMSQGGSPIAAPRASDVEIKAGAAALFDGANAPAQKDEDAPAPKAGLGAAVKALESETSPGEILYGDDVTELARKARLPEARLVSLLMDAGRLVRLTDGTRMSVQFSPAALAAAAKLSDESDILPRAARALNGDSASGHVAAAVVFNKFAMGAAPDRVVLSLALNAALRVFDDILSQPGMADTAPLQEALRWVRKSHYAANGRLPELADSSRWALKGLLRSGKVSPAFAPARSLLLAYLTSADDDPAAPAAKTPPSGSKTSVKPAAQPKTGDPVKDLRQQIEEAGMPADIRAKALEELDRFSRYRQGDPEGQKIEVYLGWLTSLPWSARTEDAIDLSQARAILDGKHSGLAEVKERILEFLAVRKRTGSKKGAIICFTGPPGTGKTSIASAIAESMGRKFVRLSLGGVNDETELRGHGRTYLGSQPGGIIRKMKEAGTINPVVLLDEIDKLGQEGVKGDPTAALLEILDPAQNDTFRDRYMDIPYDLSEVLFIATSNELQRVPAPLRDRMEIIEFSGYTALEKVDIAQKHIVDEMRRKNGLSPVEASLTDDALRAIIEGYTREAGVRTLREKVATLMRRIAAWMETRGLAAPGLIDGGAVEKFLGVPRYSAREAAPNDVGVATALAVGDLGGSAFNVEIVAYPGSGVLRLRRQMHEMIDDSAHNVYAYLRTVADKLGIDQEKFRSLDIEIAFTPAGPIDGPSAGITMAAAMASRLSGRKVKDGVAMTGEITLTGRVLPIGGLKQKVMAAHRAGYRTVIFPADNLRDVESIPEEVRKDMRLVPVKHVDEVFAEALEPARS
jgi:hypothetical protein